MKMREKMGERMKMNELRKRKMWNTFLYRFISILSKMHGHDVSDNHYYSYSFSCFEPGVVSGVLDKRKEIGGV